MDAGTTDTLTLTSLFLLGFLGSGHCLGMCGPLIVAFPGRAGGWAAHLAYNLGRVSTYCCVGGLLGAAGLGLAHYVASDSFLWTLRIQLGLSLLAALFLGVFGLSKLGLLAEPRVLRDVDPLRLPGLRLLRHRARQRGGKLGVGSLFVAGLLLGLLPCGLSFAAFARTLGANGAFEGATMMLAFGAGTMPSLFAVGAAASRLSARYRRLSDIIAGMLMIGMSAALLVSAF